MWILFEFRCNIHFYKKFVTNHLLYQNMSNTPTPVNIHSPYSQSRSKMFCWLGDSTYCSISARPRFRSVPPKSQVAYLGFDTQLSCDIVGYPRPVITWRISNTLLLVNKDRYVLANGTLVIKKTKKSDQGAYVCQAFNNLGSELGAFVLTVKQVGKYRFRWYTMARLLESGLSLTNG